MDKTYWLGRKRAAGAMAREASSAEARLIHLDMAGRYSIRAANCEPVPLYAPDERDRARDGAAPIADGPAS